MSSSASDAWEILKGYKKATIMRFVLDTCPDKVNKGALELSRLKESGDDVEEMILQLRDIIGDKVAQTGVDSTGEVERHLMALKRQWDTVEKAYAKQLDLFERGVQPEDADDAYDADDKGEHTFDQGGDADSDVDSADQAQLEGKSRALLGTDVDDDPDNVVDLDSAKKVETDDEVKPIRLQREPTVEDLDDLADFSDPYNHNEIAKTLGGLLVIGVPPTKAARLDAAAQIIAGDYVLFDDEDDDEDSAAEA